MSNHVEPNTTLLTENGINTDLEGVGCGKRPQDLILGDSRGDNDVERAGAGE